jgi:hypothetical protein
MINGIGFFDPRLYRQATPKGVCEESDIAFSTDR